MVFRFRQILIVLMALWLGPGEGTAALSSTRLANPISRRHAIAFATAGWQALVSPGIWGGRMPHSDTAYGTVRSIAAMRPEGFAKTVHEMGVILDMPLLSPWLKRVALRWIAPFDESVYIRSILEEVWTHLRDTPRIMSLSADELVDYLLTFNPIEKKLRSFVDAHPRVLKDGGREAATEEDKAILADVYRRMLAAAIQVFIGALTDGNYWLPQIMKQADHAARKVHREHNIFAERTPNIPAAMITDARYPAQTAA